MPSPYRVFSGKSFITDFTNYNTKEAASLKINELKTKHGKILARIVERKGGVFIYFEESSYKTIFGTLPPKTEGFGGQRSKKSTYQLIKEGHDNTENPVSSPDKDMLKKRPVKHMGPGKLNKPSPLVKLAPEKGNAVASSISKPSGSKYESKISSPSPPEKPGQLAQPVVYYGPPPPYLLARMSKDAQKYYLAKDAELERLSPKQVERLIEIFNAELLKFDGNFEKERPVIGRIREILSILNKLKLKFDEELVAQFLVEKVKTPLENGKFSKILKKYEYNNSRIVAGAIIKEIGRARKECPLSDIALEKEIAKILIEKYPGKFKDER